MIMQLHDSVRFRLGDLIGADYNPRNMPPEEMDKLRRSIREFGFVEPVIARAEDKLVLGGHQRIAALREELGNAADDTDIPVIFVPGLSDARAKALNVALNKIHGEWDFGKLSELLASIDMLEVDPALTGFSQAEIDDILTLMKPPTTEEIEKMVGSGAADTSEVDRQVAERARRFAFEVATDEEAALARQVLSACGMTGPGNAGQAFVWALRLALQATQADGYKPPEPPAKKPKKPKGKKAPAGQVHEEPLA